MTRASKLILLSLLAVPCVGACGVEDRTVQEGAGGSAIGGAGASGTFGLGSTDSVVLYDVDDNVIDEHTWTVAQTTGGRCPDGSGPFQNGQTATPGAANSCI
jgi:hypothetical protein